LGLRLEEFVYGLETFDPFETLERFESLRMFFLDDLLSFCGVAGFDRNFLYDC
jgi:hypothetical protein